MTTKKLIVAAIDFGTTFSGYAFSFRHDFETDPYKIQANTWIGGGHISQKAPTTILFTPQKVFHSFGYEAEDKYAELAEEEEHKDWYYFRRFKMLLHKNKSLSRSTMLADHLKKELPALTVFSSAIRYLKDHLVEIIKNRVSDIQDEDIHYVLTVPAIWNDSAKQFMREAAIEAGIVKNQLTLALEPEGASVFCMGLPIDRLSLSRPCDVNAFKNGSTYAVLDLGGGTVDITVHTVNGDGTLSEVTKASGGAWGGSQVDDAFLAFLETIVGKSFLEEFHQDNTADFVDMMREFEVKKRGISSKSVGTITMRLAASFATKYKNENIISLQERITASGYAGKLSFKRDKIQIDAEIFKNFFEKSISNTIKHVHEIFQQEDLCDISTILLVGGFADSKVIQDRIKEAFTDKSVVIPNESGLVVLKGAVLYGHNPSVIKCRVSKYTYGIEKQIPFDAKVHPMEFMYFDEDDSNYFCRYLFDVFVRAGQEVPLGSVHTKRLVTSIVDVTDGQGIYATEDPNPKYVKDPGCFMVGNIHLDTPGNEIKVEMRFGGTEVLVQITDLKTGIRRSDCFDFLCH